MILEGISKRMQVILLSFILVMVIGLGGLGVVMMRLKVARVAEHCVKLERELGVLERRCAYYDSKLSQVHNPEVLKEWCIGKLGMPKREQVIWVDKGGQAWRAKGSEKVFAVCKRVKKVEEGKKGGKYIAQGKVNGVKMITAVYRSERGVGI